MKYILPMVVALVACGSSPVSITEAACRNEQIALPASFDETTGDAFFVSICGPWTPVNADQCASGATLTCPADNFCTPAQALGTADFQTGVLCAVSSDTCAYPDGGPAEPAVAPGADGGMFTPLCVGSRAFFQVIK